MPQDSPTKEEFNALQSTNNSNITERRYMAEKQINKQDLHSLHEIVKEQASVIALHTQHDEFADAQLDTKITAVQESQTRDMANVKEKLELILEQTTRHNGRMSKIEAWRNTMIGALAILTIIIVPLLTWSLSQIVGIDKKVQDGVRTAIGDYNLTLIK